MNKIDLFIKTVGVTTIIWSNCILSAKAQTVYNLGNTDNDTRVVNLKGKNQENETVAESWYTSAEFLRESPNPNTGVYSNIGNMVPIRISQSTDSSDLQPLEPSTDLLERPENPEEVQIDLNQPITLEQAKALALRNNKNLQNAKLVVERSEKALDQAKAALFPTLGLTVGLQNSNSASDALSRERNPNNSLIEDDSTTTLNGNLRLDYDIYTGGQRGADIKRAKKQLEADELSLKSTTEQVLFETSRDYYNLQDSDSQVEIEQGAVNDANQTLNDAQLLEQAGLGTRFDVLRAEVELANAQQRLTSAIASQDVARRQLVQTLSLGEQIDLATADPIEKAGTWSTPLEDTIILGYQRRAELEEFLALREVNKEQRKILLAAIRPQVGVFAQLDALDVFDDTVLGVEDGDGIGITTGYTIGANLSWRLFDGGDARARAKQADINAKIQETGFADQLDQVRLQVEQAFFQLEANDKNIVTTQKGLELAEESLRLARLRFQAGVGTQTDVIEAQTELTTARGNSLRAVINYNQSFNSLLRAINALAEDSTPE